MQEGFCHELHIGYFMRSLQSLPSAMQSLDANRMTFLYFSVAGLHLLRALDPDEAKIALEWVLRQQVLPSENSRAGGFRPGPFSHGTSSFFCDLPGAIASFPGDEGHITMTHCALALIVLCGGDLGLVDRAAVAEHIRRCQAADGGFYCTEKGSEEDVRFVYSACVSCYLLNDWTGMDVERVVQYLASCQRYDGGCGESPHCEGHGGTSYCVTASLALLGKLDVIDRTALLRFGRRCSMVQVVFGPPSCGVCRATQ
eukprot:TRINITY_DN25782_c0_g1_i2.p1 TRINITY_DN25782_c0_g1~~TRINITY_DN25782_c0_g1_i2.p1  ORF type:complete len:256 (-),score=27.51 TRINITY_DN25782_c0_g1_i2:1367-2134(-)